jgi:hypothetical protein
MAMVSITVTTTETKAQDLPYWLNKKLLLLWNLKVHYHFHKKQPLKSIQSHLNPSHIFIL